MDVFSAFGAKHPLTPPQALDRKKYAQLLSKVLPRPITSHSQHKEWLGIARIFGERFKVNPGLFLD